MVKKLKLFMASLALFCGVVSPLLPQVAVAAPIDDACRGLSVADPNASCDPAKAQSSARSVLRSVVDILSIVTGAVSVIMIIVGGFKYVISNGDSNGLQGAKNTILYALVGLIVVLFAQVIVRFVLVNANK